MDKNKKVVVRSIFITRRYNGGYDCSVKYDVGEDSTCEVTLEPKDVHKVLEACVDVFSKSVAVQSEALRDALLSAVNFKTYNR